MSSLLSLLLLFQTTFHSHAFQVSSWKTPSAVAERLANMIPPFQDSLTLPPPAAKRNLPADQHTALVLLPGCFLEPSQYQAVATAIQERSQQAVWISVPRVPATMANPITTPWAVRASWQALQDAGYPGQATFVGGHSLGGVFLNNHGLNDNQVAGHVHIGSFRQRTDGSEHDHLPRLTLTGDLDGMIRTSRIAEDVHRHVRAKGDSPAQRLQHAVVLVQGMVRTYESYVVPYVVHTECVFRDVLGVSVKWKLMFLHGVKLCANVSCSLTFVAHGRTTLALSVAVHPL